MTEKRQFNLDLSSNLPSDGPSSVRTDRSQLSEFLGSEIRHFRKKLRDQSQDNSVGRLLNQMNIGKTSYKKNKHMRKTSSVNRFNHPFQEQFVIGMGEDNVLDLLAAPLDSRAVLQFYKNNNSNPRVHQSIEKTENPVIMTESRSQKQTPSRYEQAKLRINKNKAFLNLAEKLKLIMMDNLKTFFIRANFIAAIRAVDQKSTTARNSRRTQHQEPKVNFDRTNEMILKLKNFQEELSSNIQYLGQPKQERRKSTDNKIYNFSLANTPRNFAGKIIPPSAGTTSALETAKYAMMLPTRSENNNDVERLEIKEVLKFPTEESEAQSPSFALHNLRQETNPVPFTDSSPPQLAHLKSFLSSNSGRAGQSPHYENLPTDPSPAESLRTTFLKDSVILQPFNNKLPECSPNTSTISNSSKSQQNHLQDKSSEILSLLLNQSQSVTPAKKINNTTLDSNLQDGGTVELSSSSSLAENLNQSRQSDFLSKMRSLSQEILTPEKVTPKKSDFAPASQSSQSKSGIYPVAKLQFTSIDDKKKILSETSSLNGLISALEAKEAKEAKIKVKKSSNPTANEDETFNQIIKELSPSSSIVTPSSRKREEQGIEMDKQQEHQVLPNSETSNKVMKIQVSLLQKVQQLKRVTKIFNKYNDITFAFAQIKEHQPVKTEGASSHRSPIMGGRMNSLDLSPNSYGFALGLDKISETDSMAASARNRGSQAIFTGRSTPMSQSYSNQLMQQRIQSALQIEKILSNCLRKMYHAFFNNLTVLEDIPSPLHSESPHNENQGTARSGLSVSNNALSAKPLNNLHFIKIQEGGIQSDRTRDRSGNSTLRFGEHGLKSSARGSDSVRGNMRTVRFYEDVKQISDTFEESERPDSSELAEKEKKTKRKTYHSVHDDRENLPSGDEHQDEESFDYSPARSYQANLDELEKRLEKLFEGQITSKIEENFDKKLGQNLEYLLIKLLSKGLDSLKPLLVNDSNNIQEPLVAPKDLIPPAAAEIISSTIEQNSLMTVRERRARSVESSHNRNQDDAALGDEPTIPLPQQFHNPINNLPEVFESRRSPVAADDDDGGLEFGQKQEILTLEQDERIARTARTFSPKNNRKNIQFYSPQPTRNKNDTSEGSPSTRSHFMMKNKFTTSPGYTKKDFNDRDLHSSMAQDKSKLFSLALEKGVGEISRKIMFLFVFDKIMTRAVNDQRWSCFRKLKQNETRSPSPTRFNRFQIDLTEERLSIQAQALNTSIDSIRDLPSERTARSLYLGRMMERLFLERIKYGFYKVTMHYLRLKYPDIDNKKHLYSLAS